MEPRAAEQLLARGDDAKRCRELLDRPVEPELRVQLFLGGGTVAALFAGAAIIKSTVSFKHSKWSDEYEVRIVACPMKTADRKFVSDHDPDDIKALRSRRIKEVHHIGKPLIKLFEDIGMDLPIKRIIVAPGKEQERLWEQAAALVGGKVPLHLSKVELTTSSP